MRWLKVFFLPNARLFLVYWRCHCCFSTVKTSDYYWHANSTGRLAKPPQSFQSDVNRSSLSRKFMRSFIVPFKIPIGLRHTEHECDVQEKFSNSYLYLYSSLYSGIFTKYQQWEILVCLLCKPKQTHQQQQLLKSGMHTRICLHSIISYILSLFLLTFFS